MSPLPWARGRRILPLYLVLSVILGVAGAKNASLAGSAGTGSLVPGGAGVLDRVAYAVDGAESSHGANPRMWRSQPDGPQGPMQVSAAAATDAGGGNRFDENENRALGRAYLALMYHRYGSWPDAVAAYNWGPGHMDLWIGGGRPIDKLPPQVVRYRARVLVASGLQIGGLSDGVFREFVHQPNPQRLIRTDHFRQQEHLER